MSTNPVHELICIGLPGPTHHYGGLSPDNVASSRNRGSVSNPKQAALQALELARLLNGLGVVTAILPPQLRPHLPLLRQHFTGDDADILAQAERTAPELLEKSASAASMWTANAATIAPAWDCADGALHITTANLYTNVHRRIEAEDTYRVLKAIFAQVPHAIVHPPLTAATGMRDEGAANHMRLAPTHADKGLHVFVYGADGSTRDPASARQTLLASQAIQKQHCLAENQSLFIRQNPDVIRAGVFHNDVIAVSNESLLLAHAEAFEEGEDDMARIQGAYTALHPGAKLHTVMIAPEELSVEEAVQCYFFNSQIVSLADGGMALIAPLEVKLLHEGRGLALMERMCADAGNPITQVHTVDLRQSMRNGGGPACLRLRIQVTQAQLEALRAQARVVVDEALLEQLTQLIHHHYPDELMAADLANPALYAASSALLQELSQVMGLPLLVG